jgi:hypothetical protein
MLRLLPLVFLLLQAGAASALSTSTFHFSGQPIAGGDPGFLPDVTVAFSYDGGCDTDCQLTVVLTYNDSGGLTTIGQTLAGVSFDALGVVFDPTHSGNSVLASKLVGPGSTSADTDVGVTAQYAFGSINVAGWGAYALSSVGDLNFGEDSLGHGDLLPGTPSALEPNPPNGTSYSLVDPNTCAPGTCGGLQGGFQDSQERVWIQSQATATLVYDGSLDGIGNVRPFFGTNGASLVPEPSSTLLFALGLLISASAVRRYGRR